MSLYRYVAILFLAIRSEGLLKFTTTETTLQLYQVFNVTFSIDQELDDAILTMSSSDPSVVRICRNTTVSLKQVVAGENFSTTLEPLKIGYSDLKWDVSDLAANTSSRGIHKMRVVREHTIFVMGFGAMIAILVALNNINVGCQLDKEVVLSQLKRPIAPAIGMFCQFIFMPLVSYGTALLLLENPVTRLGLFTIGSCPGGIYSNFYTLLLQGDLDLSVTMTFMSNLGALGMMPLWMHTLGRKLAGDATPTVPFSNLIVSLIALTIPLGIGLLIQHKKPKWAKASEKIVKPFSVGILIVALVIGIYSYWYMVTLIRFSEVAAASVVVVSGFLFGASVAWLSQLNKKQIIAVSLETAIQNGPLAIVILTFSLPEPSGDLAVVPVAILVTLSSLILLTVFAGFSLWHRCSSAYTPCVEDTAKGAL